MEQKPKEGFGQVQVRGNEHFNIRTQDLDGDTTSVQKLCAMDHGYRGLSDWGFVKAGEYRVE